jgi:hypothetical protein
MVARISAFPKDYTMAFIDWSDSEGMFGLLLDLLVDERAECQEDPERHQFLSELLTQLVTVADQLADSSATALIQKLRATHESVDPEFVDDPVTVHLQDCIEELERVGTGADHMGNSGHTRTRGGS